MGTLVGLAYMAHRGAVNLDLIIEASSEICILFKFKYEDLKIHFGDKLFKTTAYEESYKHLKKLMKAREVQERRLLSRQVRAKVKSSYMNKKLKLNGLSLEDEIRNSTNSFILSKNQKNDIQEEKLVTPKKGQKSNSKPFQAIKASSSIERVPPELLVRRKLLGMVLGDQKIENLEKRSQTAFRKQRKLIQESRKLLMRCKLTGADSISKNITNDAKIFKNHKTITIDPEAIKKHGPDGIGVEKVTLVFPKRRIHKKKMFSYVIPGRSLKALERLEREKRVMEINGESPKSKRRKLREAKTGQQWSVQLMKKRYHIPKSVQRRRERLLGEAIESLKKGEVYKDSKPRIDHRLLMKTHRDENIDIEILETERSNENLFKTNCFTQLNKVSLKNRPESKKSKFDFSGGFRNIRASIESKQVKEATARASKTVAGRFRSGRLRKSSSGPRTKIGFNDYFERDKAQRSQGNWRRKMYQSAHKQFFNINNYSSRKRYSSAQRVRMNKRVIRRGVMQLQRDRFRSSSLGRYSQLSSFLDPEMKDQLRSIARDETEELQVRRLSNIQVINFAKKADLLRLKKGN